MSILRITTLIRSYRVKHLNKYRETLLKDVSPVLPPGKLKDAHAHIEKLVEEKDAHIKSFIANFVKDEHINIMLIDKGNRRWYLKGIIHIIVFMIVFNIFSFAFKHLFR